MMAWYVWMYNPTTRERARRPLAMAFIALMVFGSVGQAAISISGDADRLQTAAPEQYATLVQLFMPVHNFLELFLHE